MPTDPTPTVPESPLWGDFRDFDLFDQDEATEADRFEIEQTYRRLRRDLL